MDEKELFDRLCTIRDMVDKSWGDGISLTEISAEINKLMMDRWSGDSALYQK